MLQDIVDEFLTRGEWITCAHRFSGQEFLGERVNVGASPTLSRMGCERAPGVIRATVTKLLAMRK